MAPQRPTKTTPDPSATTTADSANTPTTTATAQTPTISITPADTPERNARPGRVPKFSPSDDLVIREVVAATVDDAPKGETNERFETTPARANATGRLSCPVTWKSIQDRYKRLPARFNKMDGQEAMMSGVGGEVGETEELFSCMKEARDDREREASEKRKLNLDKEAEKERLRGIIGEQALNRRVQRTASKCSSDDGEEERDTPQKRRRIS